MELEKPQILTYAEKSVNYTVHCARWVPSSCRFVALGERPRGTGAFQIYEIEGKFEKSDPNLKKNIFKLGLFSI